MCALRLLPELQRMIPHRMNCRCLERPDDSPGLVRDPWCEELEKPIYCGHKKMFWNAEARRCEVCAAVYKELCRGGRRGAGSTGVEPDV